MSPRAASALRRAPVALGALTLTLVAAAAWKAPDGPGRRPAAPAAPAAASPFPATSPARNPVVLHLQADERAVHGWVSGTESFAGRTVVATWAGHREEVKIGAGNTFACRYAVAAPTPAEFAVAGDSGGKPLTGRVLLTPAAAPGPCAFFVVDRTAYRPGQPLHFAAFLRRPDPAGEFEPVAGAAVEVELTSERKGTKAAKLKLMSDDRGRVVGSYTFTDADALDNYTLAAVGYKGAARVLLGEYRKSKIRLKIDGRADGGAMRLTFQALDFLDKPVAATKASFTAQVVRRPKEKPTALKGEDFVYHEPRPPSLGDLDGLSEEDLLLWEADGVSGQTFAGLGNVPLAEHTGEVTPDGAKPGEYSFPLKPEWATGDCAVIVRGVITDANGREQRGSATIPVAPRDPGGNPLELTVPKARVLAGEPIAVRAAGGAFAGDAPPAATLVVMKLSFQTPSVPVAGFGWAGDPFTGRLPAYRAGRRPPPVTAAAAAQAETVRRTLVTAVPFAGDTATVTLTQPGAYKLVVVVPGKDGAAQQQEVSVAVKRPDDLSPLVLRLDKDEFAAGDRLTGVVQCKYDGARVLLTVRDSTGVRLTKPLTVRGGAVRLDEELPAGLKYGCTVDVAYPEDADQTAVAHAFVRVVPTDRMLTVNVRTPETVAPGATVKLDLSVNRSEPVDLVVSVYDQSLLGIAPDKSTDVRNFFLADERAGSRFDADLLRRRLGDVRVGALFRKAEELLKNAAGKDGKPLTPNERSALETLIARKNQGYVYAADVGTLLRLAGVDVFVAPSVSGMNWYRYTQRPDDLRLIDALAGDMSGWRLMPRFVGNTLLLHETHPSHVAAGYRWHPVFGWNAGYGFGGYGRYAFGNFGGGGFGGAQFESYRDFAGRGGGRGDAARSWYALPGGAGMASGNAALSFAPEGQAFLSHLPAGPGPLLDADADQGHIAVRRDFSDSAFWAANLRTDAAGRATVSFKLPDSLTNWQVVATAVSPRMHVGSAKATFRTFKPVMVWPMLPRTFTEGDRVEVFASVHNRTDAKQTIKVRLKVENGTTHSPEEQSVEVPPKASVPVYWTFAPGAAGFTQLLMTADCPAGSDASLKRLPVVRAAAEQVVTASGVVKDAATIVVPPGVDPRTSRLELSFAPSLAADVADTLNYLVDYPYGCVEQTMSRFLPAIKVAQILKQFNVNHPELEKKLPGCVAGGIKRLLELQQPDGGWGWHGGGQTHEMMTPYALYGLLQAEKAGYPVPNDAAVNRGLDRLAAFVAGMGDGQAADRVYCMYVFAHRRDVPDPWWAWLAAKAKEGRLSDYALALALEMAAEKGKKDLADALADALRARAQRANGQVFWRTAGFSRWSDDPFEVTAAALKALVARDVDDELVDGVLGFFVATKRGDRWNSTKDTAMILYAMCDYLAKTRYRPGAENTLAVSVNGGPARDVAFDDRLTKKVVVPGTALKPGVNTLTFKTGMTGVLYRAVFRYWKAGRDIEPMDRGIRVERTFYLLDGKGGTAKRLKSGDSVPRGSYVLSEVVATHALPANMRYVLVENPKPGGGETVPTDDARFAARQAGTPYVLREEREAMVCFHHEETPQALQDRAVFLAELAGEFVVPPAHVELMYQTATRGHSGSFVLRVEDAAAK